MTGAEKVLKWYNDYFQMNKIVPTAREIKLQLKMAIDDEKQSEQLRIGGVIVSFLYDFVNEFTDTEIPKQAIKETLDKLNER